MPDGVEEIPARAFYRCHALRRVILPDSVKKIGKEAFAFCRTLEEIQVGQSGRIELEGQKESGEIWLSGSCIQVEERAFVGCKSLLPPTLYHV